MGILTVILLVVFAVASFLLIGVILIQDEQGEGLGGLFGGGGSTTFGARSGNILTKFTSVLAAIFLVGSFALAWLNKTPESGDILGAARRGANIESSVEEWWVVGENTAGAASDAEDGTETSTNTSNEADARAGAADSSSDESSNEESTSE